MHSKSFFVFERGISGDTISPDQFILLINAEVLEGGEKIWCDEYKCYEQDSRRVTVGNRLIS